MDQRANARYHLVENHRQPCVLPNDEALGERRTRLFNVAVLAGHSVHDANGLVREPAGVGVGHEHVAGFEASSDRANSGDVVIRLTADLELKPPVAFGSITCDGVGHPFRRVLRDGAVKRIIIDQATAQKRGDRKIGNAADEVPAGNVDPGLCVLMTAECPVHNRVEGV